MDDLAFTSPQTWITSQAVDWGALAPELPSPALRAVEAFRLSNGPEWRVVADRITGKPLLFEGGMPWIPGNGVGNALQPENLGLTREEVAANAIPVRIVAGIAKEFLKAYPDLFGVDPSDLQLIETASGPELDYLYYVDFQWFHGGIPVEKAHIVFRINNGNLVQFGQEYISDSISQLNVRPSISNEVAWEILWGYLGGNSARDRVVEPGRLIIQPVSSLAVLAGESAAPGEGLQYRLVYVLAFHREGVMGTWEARVDAHTGELISFKDENRYGHIQGGVYKTDANPTQTETVMPFPYADYGTGTYADAAGNFAGTTGTSTMTGRTGSAGNVGAVDITDDCGTISLPSSGSGLIDFGTSGGTDCTTPGVGGAGNTHAARTQYWNVAQIKIKAYTYLPTNTWLQGSLLDRVNMNQTCNAYWGAGSLHFFKSGGGCGNTGELPGVSLHEFGHGLDSNDGNGSSPDGGTGETYGDTTAFLQTHQSCMGGGFTAGNCTGYGNACLECTGVRELDYARHYQATPATPLGFNQAQCPAATCVGPCGLECHCESAPSSQANWDLVNRDLLAPPYSLDVATAWQLLDKLWYASRPTATGAFVCGNNNSSQAGNLFNVYRVVDDCDGNLANGTPHAGAIWAAFSRHGIGNASATNTDSNCGCVTLGTPFLDGANANGANNLNWTAVTGATSYDVYRNETGCSAGYTKIGNTTGTTYSDASVFNGITYYYRIQAKGTTSCPPGSMSNCVALAPQGCTPPAAPTGTNATSSANNQITVSWSNGSPPASTFNIYRAVGPCDPASYALVKTGQATSPWVDTSVSGGTVYSYAVAGLDASGLCQSFISPCSQATATGGCTLSPVFSGVGSVSGPAGANCGLTLAWASGSSQCAGSVSYNVYRSTGTFTPGPSTLIASHIPGLTFTDLYALNHGTAYYYIVRAYDSISQSEDSNLVTKIGYPGPVQPVTALSDDFETGSGLGAWTAGCVTPPCNTQEVKGIVACSPTHSGTKVFEWGGSAGSTCASNYAGNQNSMFYRAVTVPVDATNARLSFWHRWDFNAGDGGFIRLSVDAATWYYIPKTIMGAFLQGAYNGNIAYSTTTRDVWAGTQSTMTNTIVDLDAACFGTFGSTAAGKTLYIVFNGYTNGSRVGPGWFVDDVVVTYDAPASCSSLTSSPPVVPSGQGGKGPLIVTKNLSDGSSVHLTWDTTCQNGSDRFKVLWGYGSQLPSTYQGIYGLGGSIRVDGGGNPIIASPLDWSAVPSADPAIEKFVWWILAEFDATGTVEGSWGLNSGSAERTGPGPEGSSGDPGIIGKVLANTCGR